MECRVCYESAADDELVVACDCKHDGKHLPTHLACAAREMINASRVECTACKSKFREAKPNNMEAPKALIQLEMPGLDPDIPLLHEHEVMLDPVSMLRTNMVILIGYGMLFITLWALFKVASKIADDRMQMLGDAFTKALTEEAKIDTLRDEALNESWESIKWILGLA